MADNTAVNSQITDSVTQVKTDVPGDAFAASTKHHSETTSKELSEEAHNATDAQEQGNERGAPTTSGVSTLFNIDTSSQYDPPPPFKGEE